MAVNYWTEMSYYTQQSYNQYRRLELEYNNYRFESEQLAIAQNLVDKYEFLEWLEQRRE